MKEIVEVRKTRSNAELAQVHEIRRIVFVIGQNCPPELEWEHEEESVHFLATLNGKPCGAARWRTTANGYKLERFAVLSECRGHGVGAALVKAVLDDLPEDGRPRYLNAQVDAMPLYEKFQFRPRGELFEEAGIIHRQMVLSQE